MRSSEHPYASPVQGQLLGRFASDPVQIKRTLQFGDYLPASITVPDESRWDKSFTGKWGSMGNNAYGNCVICAAAHHIMSMRAAESGIQDAISDSDVIALSRSMGALNGYNILDRLKYWRSTGMFGEKIWAFSKVPASHDLSKLSIHEFGGLDLGVDLPWGWRGLPSGSIWEANQGQPGSWGGHDVIAVGYDAMYLYCVSWGAIYPMEWAAFDQYVSERYNVISHLWLAKNARTPSGFDLPKLTADLGIITA